MSRKNTNSPTTAHHALVGFLLCFPIFHSDRASVRSCVNTQTFEVALCHHMANPPGVIPLSIWLQDQHWQAAYGSACSAFMETSIFLRLVPSDCGAFLSTVFPVCLNNTSPRFVRTDLCACPIGHCSVTSLPNASSQLLLMPLLVNLVGSWRTSICAVTSATLLSCGGFLLVSQVSED